MRRAALCYATPAWHLLMMGVTMHSLDLDWATSQVKTSVDYSHGNSGERMRRRCPVAALTRPVAVMTFLCGALNYQIEHHLFPSVSQYHYPAIAPIVMDVCKKHKVTYHLLPTFSAAIGAHIEHLKDLGQKETDTK